MTFALPSRDRTSQSRASTEATAEASQSLADVAFEALRDAIVEGRLTPEEPIRQELIAARLGVSKIPLREALTRLEREGLVRSHRNRGFSVAPLSKAEAREVLALRLRIEPALVGEACERASREERALAVAAFDVLRRAGNAPGAGQHLRAYHRRLYAPGGGVLVVELVDRLARLSDRYRIAYQLGRAEAGTSAEEAVLDAWIGSRRPLVEETCAARITVLLEALDRFG